MKKVNVQIIGNYLEPLERSLKEKGIIIESIISGCNPLAMTGKNYEKYLNFCAEANMPTVLNIKKNLFNMLSRDTKTFESNYNSPLYGREVRYNNSSDYIIITNIGMGYGIFEKDGVIYSDIWPQDEFINEIKKDNTYKHYSFPFPSEFNWKYYYDSFIGTILNSYDNEHIILIKVNSAQWYFDNNDIHLFDSKSVKYRNFIEEVDDYFIEKTNCIWIDSEYNFIPWVNRPCIFPFAQLNKMAYEEIKEKIVEIIFEDKKDYRNQRCFYIDSFCKTIYKKMLPDIVKNNMSTLTAIDEKCWPFQMITKSISDSEFKDTIIILNQFLQKDSRRLSDYINDLIHSGNINNIDIKMVEVYLKYMKIDINDILAVYVAYSRYENKSEFKILVKNIVNNNYCSPVVMAKKFVQRNIDYLKQYKYIQEKLLTDYEPSGKIYIKLSERNILCLDYLSDFPIENLTIDFDNNITYTEIEQCKFKCHVNNAEALCRNIAFYIERARSGKGNHPIKIEFSSPDEFSEYLFLLNFSEILESERFILSYKDAEYNSINYEARTNLSFLFENQTRIFNIRNGLTDQICFYFVAKRAQEVCGGEIYFDDLKKSGAFNAIDQLKIVVRESDELEKHLFSNIFSPKLIEEFVSCNQEVADILFANGLNNLIVMCTDRDKDRYEAIKVASKLLYREHENYNEYFNMNLPLRYYMGIIRPEFLMKNTDFRPEKYIAFPEYDTEENLTISKKISTCDSIAIHVRRGDFITCGVYADMDFYKESMEKLKNIPDYPHKKFFIFSDDIPWCKCNLDEIGFHSFPDADITFIENNKGTNSFRDMQLMMECKVIIGSNSGFVRMAELLSEKCEFFMCYNLGTVDLHKECGKKYKYDVGEYSKNYRTNWCTTKAPTK